MAMLWPAFAMFALTAFAIWRLGRLRLAAVAAGRVDPRFYKSYRGNGEPEEIAVASRHLINLYEAPTLFYVGIVIAFAAGHAEPLLVTLAWSYTALRYLHSAIHLTSNKVRWRFRVFAVSWLVLVVYWVALGVMLAQAGGAFTAAG